MPTSTLSVRSPFLMLRGKKPNYNALKVFVCRCFPYLKGQNTNKFQPKTFPCVFIGYNLLHKGFRCYHLQTRKVFISRHVIFDEFVLPYVSTRTDLSAYSDSSYFTTFLEFSEHKNGQSLVVTPLDNSTDCSALHHLIFFSWILSYAACLLYLQQLGSSNITQNSLVSVSNSTEIVRHAAATLDNQLYHSSNITSSFTQLKDNSSSPDNQFMFNINIHPTNQW